MSVLKPVIDIDFDEATHTCTKGGRVYPSVTQIIKPLTEQAYAGIPDGILKAKADFGTAIHKATELIDSPEFELDESSLLPEWIPYIEQYKRFLELRKPEYFGIELRLGSDLYAGTIDRLAVIDGEVWVIDLKTTQVLHPHVGVQLAGYEKLVRVNSQIVQSGLTSRPIRRGALQLTDKSFKLQEYTKSFDARVFDACLTLYIWNATK